MTAFRSLIAGFCLSFGAAAALAQSAAPAPPRLEAHAIGDVPQQAPKIDLKTAEPPFVVKPYLQLGHSPEQGKMMLVWHAADAESNWAVDYRPGTGRRWQAAKAPSFRRVAVAGALPHRVYRAALTELEPGGL